ncbi:MAG: VWA domain-containing protein [Bacteroidota bacterium]|nr:VWA domain-containing protein [Bacteroidota bacterium]
MRRDRDVNITLLWMVLAAIGLALAARYVLQRFELAHPYLLYLLIPVWLTALLYMLRARRRPTIALPTLGVLEKGPLDPLTFLRPMPFTACILGASLLCLAMARPQSKENWQDQLVEGIDIMIALDVSTSMLARDLEPDRLEASKRMALEFIDGRPNDRIGLVLYEGEAFTQCPLTTDHRVLMDLFLKAGSGLIEGGTAVGMGLATAVNRLRESEAKSKVVILLTDGVNNAGTIQPMDAAQIAAQLGIRTYTIGVGTIGKALSPIARYPNGQFRYDYVDVDLDEPMMKKVAEITGGQYFRATDEKKLREIYQEIDRMEKTRVKVTEHSMRNEEYVPFVLAGAGFLLIGFLFDRSILRTMS